MPDPLKVNSNDVGPREAEKHAAQLSQMEDNQLAQEGVGPGAQLDVLENREYTRGCSSQSDSSAIGCGEDL